MSKTLSSNVVITRRFLRSVRVDADYGRLDALDGFVMQPSSSTALEVLAKHINETQQRAFTWTGPYGGGKSSLALALASLVHPDKRVQQEARRVLGVQKGDAIYRAFDAVPGDGWTVLPVLGRRGSVNEEIAKAIDQLPYRRRDRPPLNKRNLIAELVALAESPKRRGVLLIIDELGKFLEHTAKSGDDIFFYQELAEAACRARGKLIVIGILHQAFEQYASRLGRDLRDEWAKVQGRFLDIALVGGTDETLVLIGQAIDSKAVRHKETKAVVKLVATSISRARSATPGDLDLRLDRCWPLHPVTATLIGPAFKRKFGQNERSIFGFLNSVEPKGFRQFLEETTNQPHAYYFPWDFWDYLRLNLEPAILASVDGHRWALGVEAIERAEAKADEVQLQIVKTVALIELFRNGSGVAPNDDILASCFPELSRTKLQQQLRDLATKSILIFRKHLQAWGVYAGSDFDIDAATSKARAELGEVNIGAISGLSNLSPVLAKRLYQYYGAMRFLTRRIIIGDEAAAYARGFITPPGSCGEFLLILPGKDISSKQLTELAKHCSTLQRADLIVGVPREAARIIETSDELLALEHVRQSRTELDSDRVANREIEARIEALRVELEELLRDSFLTASWYWNGKQLDRSERTPLSSIASKVIESLYPQSPVLQSELINRDYPSSNSVKARRDLLYRMLAHAQEEDLGYNKFPPDAGMYFAILKDTTCHRKLGDKWGFAKPESMGHGVELLPLWSGTDEQILNANTEVNLKDLFELWGARPYGVKSGVMPILALAYYLANRNRLALYHDGIFVPELSEIRIDEWLQDPAQISWRFVQMRKGEQKFLENLSQSLADQGFVDITPDPLNVARSLVGLIVGLPEWTKRTATISTDATVVLQSLLRASDPHRVLFVDLPTLLKTDDLSRVAAIISDALQELRGAYSLMLRDLEGKLFEALDHHTAIEDLQNRAKVVSGISGDFRLDAFALRLAEYSGGENDLESLISLAVNKPSRDWTDRDLEAAVVQFGIWGMDFRRVEIIAPMKNRPANRKAFAAVFGQGDESRTTSTSIDFATQDEHAISLIAQKLRSQRPKDALGRKLFFAALVELGAEIASEYNVRKS